MRLTRLVIVGAFALVGFGCAVTPDTPFVKECVKREIGTHGQCVCMAGKVEQWISRGVGPDDVTDTKMARAMEDCGMPVDWSKVGS